MNKSEMGSSSTSGNCSTVIQNSGSETDLRLQDSNLIDERKRKRKQMNRESARRSRMRKQKQLNDLTIQVAHLREENGQFVAGINVATEHYVTLEAENSVLRAQLMELSHRLQSLNEIVDFVAGGYRGGGAEAGLLEGGFLEGVVMNPNLNLGFFTQAPIMAAAAADIFHCP
ncbi:PREDICTED: bZIP transcription factor 44 [Tarenaya hassleriana]|uniref:bZIP transcription factor 44 n=1 Tax=Tarenaya hassleriana TaxID=28532 RepID=UPI00053C258C|nr:PREDICTED: bZIP transcription factor 44 [Tarenaya hassleriana]